MLKYIILRTFDDTGDRRYYYVCRVGETEYKILGAEKDFLVKSVYDLNGIVECLNSLISKYFSRGHTLILTVEVADHDLCTSTSPIPEGLCLKNISQLDVRYWRE